jgi:hypothetical protein
VSWSISPALPAGLTFDTTSGRIEGTPTEVSSAASYVVTAQNSGGAVNVSLTIAVQSGVLVDVGHIGAIAMMRLTDSRLLSVDDTGAYWVLWDYPTARKIMGGAYACVTLSCKNFNMTGTGLLGVDLAGETLVYESATGLQVRSASDGTLLGTIPIAAPLSWWKLSADGSYICIGTSTEITVWSPQGVAIATRAGDYSQAVAFAAPGSISVALGPAGQSVIETISLPAGASSVSPAYQGQFQGWFADGHRFLTTVANTVFVYSSDGQQQDLAALPTAQHLAGTGSWFWSYGADNVLNIYPVGASGSPAASYTLLGPYVNASGPTLEVATTSTPSGAISVIDLSGANPVRADHPVPISGMSAYVASSSTRYVIGSGLGVLFDGASPASSPRYFGYGAPLGIAGSDTTIAVATASGTILLFDVQTRTLQGTIDFLSSKVALSEDGTTLVAMGEQPDDSLHVYTLPSASLTYAWPYTTGSVPQLFDFFFPSSGAVLGQILGTSPPVQVTAPTGGAPIWSVDPGTDWDSHATRISPDGTLLAVSTPKMIPSGPAGTNIYKNGVLSTAISGWAVGWLDNNRLLVNNYILPCSCGLQFTGAKIYDVAANTLAASPLPELQDFQIAGPDGVYDATRNEIFSVTSGAATWTTANPVAVGLNPVGAIAGGYVVFASGGGQVRAEPY